MSKKILFNGVPYTKRQFDALASEAAVAVQNFNKIWDRQKQVTQNGSAHDGAPS